MKNSVASKSLILKKNIIGKGPHLFYTFAIKTGNLVNILQSFRPIFIGIVFIYSFIEH